jgi:ribose transport system substrate-binding protein
MTTRFVRSMTSRAAKSLRSVVVGTLAVPIVTLAFVANQAAAQELMRPLEESAKVIAVSFPNSSTIGAVMTTLDQLKKVGAEAGYEVIIHDPGTDMNKQINTLRTWIQQKVAVIVAVVPNPEAFETIAKQAREAGTIWMTYGETLENQDATVGFSQYADGRRLGEYAGQWITENLGGKAKVAILGYDLATWGRLRGSGIKEGLLEFAPNVDIVAEQNAITPSEGLDTTRNILQANPEINVILGVEDPATEGAYKAWVASGRDKNQADAFIGGMDGTVPALRLLRAGDTVYRASMAIPLAGFGDGILEKALELLGGTSSGPEYIVPLELITRGSERAQFYLDEQGQGE